MGNYIEQRTWGTFEILLEEKYCKVKRLIIEPGKSISYQYHYKRSETWVIVQGVGEFTLDGAVKDVKAGDVLYVPVLAHHKIKNTGPDNLIFIETQTGESFSEDDIVRIHS
jgi:mannose-6-phosphate isomerase